VLLRWGGSLLVLGLLIFFLRKNLPDLAATVRRVPLAAWALLLAGYMSTHIILVTKWRLMVNLAGADLGWRAAVRSYFAGLFGNLFLPSLVGGDVIRAGLGMAAARSRAGLLLGSFLDRMLDIAALALLAACGAAMLPRELDEPSRRIFFVVAGLFALAALAAAAAMKLLAPRLKYGWRRKAVKVRRAWRSMAQRPQYVATALLMGLSAQSILILLMAQLSYVAGLDVPLHLWFFAFPIAKLSALLPVTQGGIGVREAVQAAVLAPFGAPPQRVVAVGLVWETLIISGGLLGALIASIADRAARGARVAEQSASQMSTDGKGSAGNLRSARLEEVERE
jgi:uncharacterized protein (TIRG00374 family)